MTFTSWAQNFEDVMLWRALSDVSSGCFIDIGAQDPELDSVSRAFLDKGWRGIHVEATPTYAAAMRSARPDDRVIEAAVSDRGGIMQFYSFPGTGLSTGVSDIAARHRDAGFAMQELIVPTVTLHDIFSAVGAPEVHWLKIDVEGMEREVLAGWGDAPQRPWVVLVESVVPLSQQESHSEWEAELIERGYLHVYSDGLNRFYIASDRDDLAARFTVPPSVFDHFSVAPTHWLARPIVASAEEAARAAEERLEERSREVEALAETAGALRQRAEEAEQALAAGEARAEAAQALLQRARIAEQALEQRLARVQASLRQREEEKRRLETSASEAKRAADVAALRIEQLQSGLAAQERGAAEQRAGLEAARDAEQRARLDLETALVARNGDVRALERRIAAVTESRSWRWLGPLRGRHRDADLGDLDALGATRAEGIALVINAELAEVPTSVSQLLELHDAHFVRAAYRAILGREPDPEGAAYYLRRIRAGEMRHAVIVELAGSAEGRNRRSDRMKGMRAARRVVRRARTPIIGSLSGAERARGLDRRLREIENRVAAGGLSHRLPFHADVSDGDPAPSLAALLRLEGEAFVSASYRTLLRREPDPEGTRYYVGRLADGRSKISILDQMCRSDEYREHGRRIPGLGAARRRMRATHIPLLGAAAQSLFGGEGDSSRERRVRRLAFLAGSAAPTRQSEQTLPEAAAPPPAAPDIACSPAPQPQSSLIQHFGAAAAGPALSAKFTPRARALLEAVRHARMETID